MIYFMRQFLGQILSDRRSTIEAAIQEAEKKCKDAAIALAEQQQKLAQAEVEAEKIRKQAAENAAKAKAAILAQATEDVKRLKETVVQDLDLVRERAIAELRQRVVKQALTQAESQLKGRMDESVQQRLVERSISLLGGSQ
jgi:F-type H+-transporting ATPase subunit b